MDVVCDRCRAEYEFDDALVSERGTTVKCTNCGHQFKIYRPASHPDVGRSWNLRRPDGTVIPFDSLAVLQKWILEGRVSKMDEISRGGEGWKPLGNIAELESFFSTAELRASQVPSPPKPSLRPPPVPGRPPTPPMGMPLPKPPPSNVPVGAPRLAGGLPVTTAHGYPSPLAAGRPDHSDTSRTAPIGTPMLPPAPPAHPHHREVPSAALSTADGYALGPTGHPEVAIAAPPAPSRSRPPPAEESAPPASVRPVAHASSPPDDDDSSGPILPPPSTSRGVVVGLSLGLVLACGLAVGAWKFGYLNPQGGASPTPPAQARPQIATRIEAAQRLVSRGTLRALEDAREELTHALALDPESAPAHAARAQAVALWAELRRQHAEDIEARARVNALEAPTLRAEAAVLRRDANDRLERARADMQTAERGASGLHGDARIALEAALADVARVAGDLPGARRHVDAARAEGALSPDAELAAALIARDSNNATQAVEGLRGVLARAGDRARARLSLARLLVAQGDGAGARRELEAVLQAYPDHEDAQSLTQALTRNEPPMTVGTLVAAASTDAGLRPEVAPVTNVGVPDAGAVAAVAPTTNSAPATERSYDQLVSDGDRMQDEGRSGAARERYRAALSQRPSGCEALAGLGFADLEDRQLGSAVSNFRRSLSANPRYTEALVGLGEAYTSMGNYAQALDAYNRYLEASPGGEHAHMARRQIESLQERLRPSQDSVDAAAAPRN